MSKQKPVKGRGIYRRVKRKPASNSPQDQQAFFRSLGRKPITQEFDEMQREAQVVVDRHADPVVLENWNRLRQGERLRPGQYAHYLGLPEEVPEEVTDAADVIFHVVAARAMFQAGDYEGALHHYGVANRTYERLGVRPFELDVVATQEHRAKSAEGVRRLKSEKNRRYRELKEKALALWREKPHLGITKLRKLLSDAEKAAGRPVSEKTVRRATKGLQPPALTKKQPKSLSDYL